ncbi:hypothetical protein FRC17_002677 [Serendipita sp. 399]|nr:hypothetical protein FRC17_002677 [Serendipita sp. 399]
MASKSNPTMNTAAVLHSAGHLTIEQRPRTTPPPGHAEVQIMSTTLCGSDRTERLRSGIPSSSVTNRQASSPPSPRVQTALPLRYASANASLSNAASLAVSPPPTPPTPPTLTPPRRVNSARRVDIISAHLYAFVPLRKRIRILMAPYKPTYNIPSNSYTLYPPG